MTLEPDYGELGLMNYPQTETAVTMNADRCNVMNCG